MGKGTSIPGAMPPLVATFALIINRAMAMERWAAGFEVCT